MATFTASQQALMVPEVYAMASAVDPNIVYDGAWNGVDINAIIATETQVYHAKILASDIQAQNWETIIAQLTALSTSAGDTPNPVQ